MHGGIANPYSGAHITERKSSAQGGIASVRIQALIEPIERVMRREGSRIPIQALTEPKERVVRREGLRVSAFRR